MKEHILNLDRPRMLRFGFKAIRLIREKFGDRDVSDLMEMKVDEMPVLAWAGLTWEDENLTIEQTEKLLDQQIPDRYKVLEILEIIAAAIADQVGIEVEKKKTKPSAKSSEPPSQSG